MPGTNHQPFGRNGNLEKKQRGGASVEFALLAIIFLSFLFGVLEIARAIYLFNILPEVTRRAGTLAANSRFDTSTLAAIRKEALFPDRNGNLLFGAPITPAHLRIDYLSIARDSVTGAVTPQSISIMPACPTKNRANCLANPYDASCIRLVRVRICQPGDGDTCTQVPYKMQFPFVDLSRLRLPRSETIVPANTLGYKLSSGACL
jgi:hypothetical protein